MLYDDCLSPLLLLLHHYFSSSLSFDTNDIIYAHLRDT